MIYRLSKHRGEGHNFLRFTVIPIRDANFIEIKHQFGDTALYVPVHTLNESLEKRSRYLRALPLLRTAFCFDDLIRIPKDEGIHPSSSRFDLKLRRTIIHDFFSRDWCVLFCVLVNPVEILLCTILIEGDMLSSLPRCVQPMREGRVDTRSWTGEYSGQCINGDWDILTRLCNNFTNAIWWYQKSGRRKFGSPVNICRRDLKNKAV
jgi:hypothetical protein